MTPAIKYILVGLDLVSHNPERIIVSDPKAGVAVVRIEHEMEEHALSIRAHLKGRCGGYEYLPELGATKSTSALKTEATSIINDLAELNQKHKNAKTIDITLQENTTITEALAQISPDNIGKTIEWFSSYKNRYNRSPNANEAVEGLFNRVTALVSARSDAEVSYISHRSTPQKSVRVRLPGTSRSSEVIVLGGHLDSIAGFMGGAATAPGADDNASGTASLMEALRVLASMPPLARTVEFMFYGGEESGLLGSAEIAKTYKQTKVDVVSVLQLDMTSFPGSGKFVMASMTDFTNPTLREYLVELNKVYIGNTIVDDKCGYGCSDHASWFRQGFATLMPTESRFREMNREIHTAEDVINSRTSFEHAASFAKVALAMAMDLGQSTQRF